MMSAAAPRYTAVAIVLHWAIAFAIAFMIPLGWWMHEAVQHPESIAAGTAAFQLHKSVGLTILVLSLARLAWRLAHKPPGLPDHMPQWEKVAALATHWLFYFLIIAMPLTGWLYVSTAWSTESNQPLPVTTLWFHLFRVPPLFDLNHASEATRRSLAFIFVKTHWALAWGAIALATLHVAAALKHQFVDRDEVLGHMVPGVRGANLEAPPKNPARLAALGGGFALIAVAAIALYMNVTHLTPPPAPPTPLPVETPTTQNNAATIRDTTPSTAVAAADQGPAAGAPPAWIINHSASSIRFSTSLDSGEGVRPINGRFGAWRGVIHFDPANLDKSTVVVTINTASAADSVDYDNANLQSADFFNVASFATAEFRTSSIRHLQGNAYEARGTLRIKDKSVSVRLPFTLAITGANAVMDGRVSLTRAATGMGTGNPDADRSLSPNVSVTIHVEAARAG